MKDDQKTFDSKRLAITIRSSTGSKFEKPDLEDDIIKKRDGVIYFYICRDRIGFSVAGLDL